MTKEAFLILAKDLSSFRKVSLCDAIRMLGFEYCEDGKLYTIIGHAPASFDQP